MRGTEAKGGESEGSRAHGPTGCGTQGCSVNLGLPLTFPPGQHLFTFLCVELRDEQTQTLHRKASARLGRAFTLRGRVGTEGWCRMVPSPPCPGLLAQSKDSTPPQRSLEGPSPLTCSGSHLAPPLRGRGLPAQLATLLPTQHRPQKPFPAPTQTPSPPRTPRFWVRTGCRTSGSGKAPTPPSGSHTRLPLGSHQLHEKPRPAIPEGQAHQLLGEMSIITAIFVDPADGQFFLSQICDRDQAQGGELRRLGFPPTLLSPLWKVTRHSASTSSFIVADQVPQKLFQRL